MEMHADDDFTLAFDYASGGTAERFQNPLWFVTEVFFGGRLRKSIATVKAFGQRIVANAEKDRQGRHASDFGVADDADSKLDEVSGTLIQSLLDAVDDQNIVADSALNYLSAGKNHLPPAEKTRS